jgi:putative ABC transport system substrate-binding protein
VDRRAFLGTVAGGLLAAPLASEAQPAGKVVRIGYLSLQREDGRDGDQSWVAAFRQRLRDLGYVEGRNVAIEQRHAAGRADRLPELASELVRLKLNVLVVFGLSALIDAGWKAPDTLPIVFTIETLIRWGGDSSPALRAPAGTSPGCRTLTLTWCPNGWSCSRRPPHRPFGSGSCSILPVPSARPN